MKILVTGDKGFVGKYLIKVLQAGGHAVSGFDRASGKELGNEKQVRAAVKGQEVVFHLAAVLDETAGNMEEINVEGTQNLLDACIRERVERLVLLSTMGVVGDAPGIQDEETPYQPVTRYERSKMEAERKVLDAQEVIPVSVVRAPIIYGPGSYWEKVIGYARNNYPLIGNGNNAWQMVYVEDLVDALVFVMEKDTSSGEIYLAAEEKHHSLREVYQEMRKHLGMGGEPRSVPYGVALLASYPLQLVSKITGKKALISPAMVRRAVRDRKYNTRKLRTLGWKPKYTLQQGMEETFKVLKNRNISR